MNINYSIPETTIYTFSDKYNTESCLNRYDKMRPLVFQNRTRAISARKMVYSWIGFYMIYRLHVTYSDKVSWIGFYMIYRLHVTYSDKVSFPMFIKVKCLIWYDSRCHFRLLSALPVKTFQIALFFYSSLVYMHPIFCRYFLFLIIGNIL